MKNTALVAFKGTIAHKVMDLCVGFDSFSVGSSKKSIEYLVESGMLGNYDSILAMGLKNGSRDVFVHVEQVCFKDGKQLSLETNVADDELFKLTSMQPALEKSWCNMLAAVLKTSYPDKHVSFLHIPPRADVALIADRLVAKFR